MIVANEIEIWNLERQIIVCKILKLNKVCLLNNYNNIV